MRRGTGAGIRAGRQFDGVEAGERHARLGQRFRVALHRLVGDEPRAAELDAASV